MRSVVSYTLIAIVGGVVGAAVMKSDDIYLSFAVFRITMVFFIDYNWVLTLFMLLLEKNIKEPAPGCFSNHASILRDHCFLPTKVLSCT